MLSCKETSYLASKKLDEKLTKSERLGFWLHIALCSLCRRYARDIKKLHSLMLKASKNSLALLSKSEKLSEQSRERIKKLLSKAIGHSE
jgi:predicted anti-sigma-YlaC factor YlaD